MTFVYIPSSSCFLSNTAMFFSAFLASIFVIILFNLVIFVIVVSILIKHARRKLASKDQANWETVIRTLISITGLTALYGLTWLFGAFTIQDASVVFQILFTIFSFFQGFFIFLFFCAFGKEARELWLQVLCCGKMIPASVILHLMSWYLHCRYMLTLTLLVLISHLYFNSAGASYAVERRYPAPLHQHNQLPSDK